VGAHFTTGLWQALRGGHIGEVAPGGSAMRVAPLSKSERTFRKLGSNRDLIPLYNKWFVARLPTGEKLNVAISPQLVEAFKVLNDSEGASN
jgi:hypothetical protein